MPVPRNDAGAHCIGAEANKDAEPTRSLADSRLTAFKKVRGATRTDYKRSAIALRGIKTTPFGKKVSATLVTLVAQTCLCETRTLKSVDSRHYAI